MVCKNVAIFWFNTLSLRLGGSWNLKQSSLAMPFFIRSEVYYENCFTQQQNTVILTVLKHRQLLFEYQVQYTSIDWHQQIINRYPKIIGVTWKHTFINRETMAICLQSKGAYSVHGTISITSKKISFLSYSYLILTGIGSDI